MTNEELGRFKSLHVLHKNDCTYQVPTELMDKAISDLEKLSKIIPILSKWNITPCCNDFDICKKIWHIVNSKSEFDDGDVVYHEAEGKSEPRIVTKNNSCGDYSKLYIMYHDGSTELVDACHYKKTGQNRASELREMWDFEVEDDD